MALGQGYQALHCDRVGDVLRVAIQHPASELNTVDALLHGEFAQLFRELKREDAARAVLLTGRGRAFSAGGDFGWFPTLDDLEKLEHLRRDAKQLIWDLLDVELPIVAALNGHAVGLGASIALLCDVIFMSESATICDPHVRVGIVAGDGGTAIWPLVLGPARAKEFLLTGDKVEAADALRMGLVNRVVAGDQLLPEALALARTLATEVSPRSVRVMKRQLWEAPYQTLGEAVALANAEMFTSLQSEDFREGVAHFQERRPARFTGR